MLELTNDLISSAYGYVWGVMTIIIPLFLIRYFNNMLGLFISHFPISFVRNVNLARLVNKNRVLG